MPATVIDAAQLDMLKTQADTEAVELKAARPPLLVRALGGEPGAAERLAQLDARLDAAVRRAHDCQTALDELRRQHVDDRRRRHAQALAELARAQREAAGELDASLAALADFERTELARVVARAAIAYQHLYQLTYTRAGITGERAGLIEHRLPDALQPYLGKYDCLPRYGPPTGIPEPPWLDVAQAARATLPEPAPAVHGHGHGHGHDLGRPDA